MYPTMVNFFQDETSKGVRPKGYQGIIRCRPKNSEAVAMRSGAHVGLMCPLEKGVRGIEAGHQMPGRSWRAGKVTRRWKARRP